MDNDLGKESALIHTYQACYILDWRGWTEHGTNSSSRM